jgi:hypothetical protein
MPGKAVESTIPLGSVSRPQCLDALPGWNASERNRPGREPRAGVGGEKSYPAGQKLVPVNARWQGATRRDPGLSPLPSLHQ